MTYQFFHWRLIGLAGGEWSKEEKLGQLMPGEMRWEAFYSRAPHAAAETSSLPPNRSPTRDSSAPSASIVGTSSLKTRSKDKPAILLAAP
jgi:hypothetical protein